MIVSTSSPVVAILLLIAYTHFFECMYSKTVRLVKRGKIEPVLTRQEIIMKMDVKRVHSDGFVNRKIENNDLRAYRFRRVQIGDVPIVHSRCQSTDLLNSKMNHYTLFL